MLDFLLERHVLALLQMIWDMSVATLTTTVLQSLLTLHLMYLLPCCQIQFCVLFHAIAAPTSTCYCLTVDLFCKISFILESVRRNVSGFARVEIPMSLNLAGQWTRAQYFNSLTEIHTSASSH